MTTTEPTPRPDPSTQLRSPGQDLQSDERMQIYIAVLQTQVIRFAQRDIQWRAIAEAATGVPYDSFDPMSVSLEYIQEVVAQDMVRGLSVSIDEARSLVQENWQTANPSQMESPSLNQDAPALNESP